MDLITISNSVEILKNGDRELDSRILRAITPEFSDMFTGQEAGGASGWLVGGDHLQPEAAPDYTSDIRAAISLIPKGWRLSQMGEWDDLLLRERGPWLAILIPAGKSDDFSWATKARCNHAFSPALAVTTAALRARALGNEYV